MWGRQQSMNETSQSLADYSSPTEQMLCIQPTLQINCNCQTNQLPSQSVLPPILLFQLMLPTIWRLCLLFLLCWNTPYSSMLKVHFNAALVQRKSIVNPTTAPKLTDITHSSNGGMQYNGLKLSVSQSALPTWSSKIHSTTIFPYSFRFPALSLTREWDWKY